MLMTPDGSDLLLRAIFPHNPNKTRLYSRRNKYSPRGILTAPCRRTKGPLVVVIPERPSRSTHPDGIATRNPFDLGRS